MNKSLMEQPGPWEQFQHYLNDNQFMLQRSKSSGRFTFYPRVQMPATGETDWEWVAASGNAVVYSVTHIPRKSERGGDYNVAIVELAEGPRLMSQVEGSDNNAVHIGMPVKAKIGFKNQLAQLNFVPVATQ